jgi:hypothetical protein
MRVDVSRVSGTDESFLSVRQSSFFLPAAAAALSRTLRIACSSSSSPSSTMSYVYHQPTTTHMVRCDRARFLFGLSANLIFSPRFGEFIPAASPCVLEISRMRTIVVCTNAHIMHMVSVADSVTCWAMQKIRCITSAELLLSSSSVSCSERI